MKQRTVINRFLLAKPNIIFLIGFLIILIIGALGEVFNWIKIPFSPYSNIIGGIIAVCGWLLHLYCHRIHKQAHKKSEQIDEIVTTGIFSKIRHPMYLGMILGFLGVSIAWGVVWMLIPAVLFSLLAVLIAIKEEEYLLQKFGRLYGEYMQKVPWRFIVKIF
jgi:protein-S-isoprenylcysteine O-methyltransferase Ste14